MWRRKGNANLWSILLGSIMSPTQYVWGVPMPLKKHPQLSRNLIIGYILHAWHKGTNMKLKSHLSIWIHPTCTQLLMRAVSLPWLSRLTTYIYLLLSFPHFTHFVQWFKQIQRNSDFGIRSYLKLVLWLQSKGRTQTQPNPQGMSCWRAVCAASRK